MRYHALFADAELPVPVHRIAEDLLGLHVATGDLKDLSGALYPARREILVNVGEPETRRRFTLATSSDTGYATASAAARNPSSAAIKTWTRGSIGRSSARRTSSQPSS
jgi:hypothetical protein